MSSAFQVAWQLLSKLNRFSPSFTPELCAKLCTNKNPGRISPAVLRLFYKDLIGDCSAAHDLPESMVDECVHEILAMEPVVDLQEVKHEDTR